ncbi:hypothetical protein HYV49_02885 [Candidatus Pacearchaeota archaeon]|nr:hypothetical protein [Candidatus Pacearchaeota archaeon]
MEENKSFFLQYLGDNPKVRVIDFLMDNFALDFSLPQIAEGSDVAYTTLISILTILLRQNIMVETRKIGKSKLFKINLDNPVVKALFAIDLKLSEAAIQTKASLSNFNQKN